MDRYPSILDLDEAARAPEINHRARLFVAPEWDHDATAFELDRNALAPETVPSTIPQVLYDNLLPETQESSVEEQEASVHELNLSSKIRWTQKLRWTSSGLLLAIVIGIGIGVGVGVSQYRKASVHKPSPISPPTSLESQSVLTDTSLAAAIFSSGDRHVFFQDASGLIRRATYTSSNTSWLSGLDHHISANAKNHTPLSAALRQENPDQIDLFFVTENNHLNSYTLLITAGYWTTDSSLTEYAVAIGSRRLAFAGQNVTSNYTTNTGLLFYEFPLGRISALLRRLEPNSSHAENVVWVDVTSNKSKSLPDEYRNRTQTTLSDTAGDLSPPFQILVDQSSPRTNLTVSGIALTPEERFGQSYWDFDVQAFANILYNGTMGLFEYEGTTDFSLYLIEDEKVLQGANVTIGPINEHDPHYFDDPPDLYPIEQSDVAIFDSNLLCSIWINGTKPILGQECTLDAPLNEFPFRRLATASPADESATFLYHQINETTLAEEHWIRSARQWLPTQYIQI